MKRFSIFLIVATIGFFSWALPANAAKKPLTPQEEEELAGNRAMAQEAISFSSAAAQNARNPGSPVGPPQRVRICWKGKTISVPEPAWISFQKKGATFGPCDKGGGKPKGGKK